MSQINIDTILAEKLRIMANAINPSSLLQVENQKPKEVKIPKEAKKPIPDDGQIHIRVKNRKHKFNFND